MMNKGFQNGISQFEKKITPTLPISFHSFGNLKKVCKTFFFHVDMIALAAYTEQLLPRGKAAVCCILPRSIVWTHLNATSFNCVSFLLFCIVDSISRTHKRRGTQFEVVAYICGTSYPSFQPPPANLTSCINLCQSPVPDNLLF